jgi:hypothetical protein
MTDFIGNFFSCQVQDCEGGERVPVRPLPRQEGASPLLDRREKTRPSIYTHVVAVESGGVLTFLCFTAYRLE